uniref:NADH-ubiquinone oxidoreductase chain 1 n=1 Tax=Elateroidea sp. BMNH 1274729 TaxID=1796501 RepID=A0A126TGC8_9COLE|nr:NADH dehydrogenase subunit 1 [Elateroidea sp. BMNH 1274729]
MILWYDLGLFGFNFLLVLILVLVSVGFFTLMERKVLSYLQNRKGPGIVGSMGLIQPLGDGFKLFSKEQTYLFMSNFFMYYFSPVFNLFLALLLWVCFPLLTVLTNFNLGILFFLCCSSLGVYTIMVAGWSSNSAYSLVGGLRSVAQSISYEVSLALVLLSFLFVVCGLSMDLFVKAQGLLWLFFLNWSLAMVWFISSLAETNRTPFDLAEGESELVSGFNIEYSSAGFALIFLAEYSNILFMSMLFSLFFLGGNLITWGFFIKVMFISFVFLWVRGTLPRLRYDKLMFLTWKGFLPVALNCLVLFYGLEVMVLAYNL